MRFRRSTVPAALSRVLAPDERILAGARTVDGPLLAATRYGLWLIDGDAAARWDWHVLSRARLAARTLQLTPAREYDRWPDGTVLLLDEPPRDLPLEHVTRLTDIVHDRVRRSVAASRRLDWPGAGGWVTLRRVAGRDGLTAQIRLDPGADPGADGFAAAVALTIDEIWPEQVPRPAPPVG